MIYIENLKKAFGRIQALNDVSLNIEDRQVFGLVGTNGAGKSTMLRIISGILRQDSGRVEVLGQPVYDNPAIKKNIFFIPDDPYFFRNGNAGTALIRLTPQKRQSGPPPFHTQTQGIGPFISRPFCFSYQAKKSAGPTCL